MPKRRLLPLILPLLALPTLLACGADESETGPPPPTDQSLAAVSENAGAPRQDLARAFDALFDSETVGQTRALLVLHGGEVVGERYAEGFGPDSRFQGWSMGTCVTAIMIGQLVSDGRLRLDETAPVPAWQRSGEPRGEITLRQLLQMRSGLRHVESKDDAPGDGGEMMFLSGRDDMAAYAEAQPLEHEPGRQFEYSSASAVILADLAARSLTERSAPDARRKLVATYLRTRFLDPAGLDSVTPEFDAAGTMIGSGMIHATALDWGRLGEFLRHYGSVKGAQVVPRRWIEFMRSPSPRNPGYGAGVWLNAPQPDGAERLFPGKAPKDVFACIGGQGDYVIGVPSRKLTIVRLGPSDPEQMAPLRDRLEDLIALYAGS